MKKHTQLRRATAAALLAAALATPAVVGLTAGTANAKPREGSCYAINQAKESSLHMANVARDQGDTKAARMYMQDAARASANYQRYCVS